MSQQEPAPGRLRWARVRYSIIGQLFSRPPEPGELQSRIEELSQQSWQHPTTGEARKLSAKTIERMYYTAKDQVNPVGALTRKVPKHAGKHPDIFGSSGF